MISKKLKELVNNNELMKTMFEEGNKLKEKYGEENVYDFSIGNPNLKAPDKVKETIIDLLNNMDSVSLHGYTPNNGYYDVRNKIALSINEKYNTDFDASNIVMTSGAASGLNIIFKSVLEKDDEVIVFTPYFSEYDNYIENYDGKVVRVKTNEETFLPNLSLFEKSITPKTKAVIINTPNNPTGVIYDKQIIKNISTILDKKQKEYNKEIYLISDEPYREIVYDNIKVPYVSKYYNNTFIVYSFSKSLSLPGERIGYVVVPKEMTSYKQVLEALSISNRILGIINAPSLIQKAVASCLNEKVDIDYYQKNRDKLIEIMDKCGFTYLKPEGTFYLFVKTKIDDKKFCQIAKKYNLLFVPASSFYCPGYVRIAFCVSYDTIVNSEKAFLALKKELEKNN